MLQTNEYYKIYMLMDVLHLQENDDAVYPLLHLDNQGGVWDEIRY